MGEALRNGRADKAIANPRAQAASLGSLEHAGFKLSGRPRDEGAPLRFPLSLASARAVLFRAGDDFAIAGEIQAMTGVHVGRRFASRGGGDLFFQLRGRTGRRGRGSVWRRALRAGGKRQSDKDYRERRGRHWVAI